nr:UvrD-helicase domain-containing protein [uncultured Acetatifactor sp.]
MAVTFTQEQSMAIELHGRNILVSAAAGSGKTAVLVERIVRMVCDEAHPVDIDRLLVVTFTNAAAAEMRERIAAGISKRLTERPDSVHIQRQSTLLHNAQITTIDSFCLFLLRNHFNEIGLDPAFRIADEGEVRLMQGEALEELIEASYASGSEAFRYCVEFFCPGGRESVLEQHILNLSRYAASFPWPARWLKERKEDYGAASVEQMCASSYALWLREHLRRLLSGCVEKLERVQELCEAPDGPYMYGELVDRELEQLKALAACDSLEAYAVRLPAVSFGRLPAKKDESVSPIKRELAKAMRASVKDSIRDMEERYFATPLELAARQGAACAGPVGTLIDLVLEFDRRMQEKKQDRKVIDFSDMEHFALGILLEGEGEEARPSAVALEYRQHFVEILTDEYQDSNLVQEYLLKAVSGEADGNFNRFMVGDVKQSIYKFRLARPELFLEKYNSYEGAGVPMAEGDAAPESQMEAQAGSSEGRRAEEAVSEGQTAAQAGSGGGLQADETVSEGYRAGQAGSGEGLRADDAVSAGQTAGQVGSRERLQADEAAGPEAPDLQGGPGLPGSGCVRIDLARNFRSRLEVVDAVNDVFSRLMSQTVGGIPYDERAALYPGASYPDNGGCGSELLLAEKPVKGDDLSAKQAEALVIAQEIKRLRGSFSVTDRGTGELRAARYSDMVILLRTNSGWDEEFKEVLEGQGIPVYITSKTGYFAAAEVQELLQLLRVLDNPSQDIPLFGVMKSVFGGFSEEEAAIIRSSAKDCCLYDALKFFAREHGQWEEAGSGSGVRTDSESGSGSESGLDPGAMPGSESGLDSGAESDSGARIGSESRPDLKAVPDSEAGKGSEPEGLRKPDGLQGEGPDTGSAILAGKAAGFLRMIAKYRECTVYLPIRALLTKLIGDFGYLDYVTALPAGSRRRANVEMLLTRASDFENTSYFGLFHFIRYMEQLERYDVDYGGAELLDENADVVRIMSIHKSKGLEFPVTFVAGLSKRFNMQDVNQSLILDMDMGLGTDFVDPGRRVRNRTLRRMALAGKLREESLSEELRLLYVAMTRAREKLILTGVTEHAQESWEQVMEAGHKRLTYLDFMEAGSFLDFLLPVLPHTCVQVTVQEQVREETEEIREQIQLYQKKEALDRAEQFADQEAGRRLAERLNAVYPYAVLSDLYTKTTVSELKIAAMADRDEAAFHAFEEKEVQPYIPQFRRGEEKISGAVRGNAYHRVMELLDFQAVLGAALDGDKAGGTAAGEAREAAPGSGRPGEVLLQAQNPAGAGEPAEIPGGVSCPETYEAYRQSLRPERLAAVLRAFLEAEAESGRLSVEYLQAVRQRKIENFLQSPLAWRMWLAQRRGGLYREQPFVLGIDARRLKSDFPETETVLIQGIIDVFFEEEDGIVLLDYKTDAISSMKELWNRYETQLDYYQEAVRKLSGKPVKERILYSFHLETY